jgi:thioredoxin 1
MTNVSQVQTLTSSTFDRAVSSPTIPVLVDFYASWCPPCKALAPVLDQLSEEFAGRVAFFKVNVDEEPELAARFNVQAVPTLSLFAGGRSLAEIPGYVAPSKLRQFLESVVAVGTRAATGRD